MESDTFSPDTYFSENSLNMNHSLQSLKVCDLASRLNYLAIHCQKCLHQVELEDILRRHDALRPHGSLRENLSNLHTN